MAPPVIEPVPLPDPDTGTPQVVVGQPQTKRTTAPTMRAVLELLADTDEIGIVGFGQSNRVPQGDRDTEGFVAAPHLVLRPAGLDLTIHSIVSAVTGSAHGAVGTRSVVNVAEELTTNDWVNGELRLVQFDYGDSTPSSLRRGHAIVQSCLGSASATTAAGIVLNSTANTVIWANHGRAEGSLVHFTTSGSLPGALTSGLPVYVCNVTANSFQVSASPPGYGAVLSLAGGSGTHTVTARPHLLVKWSSAFQSPQASTTFSSGTPGVVNQTAHGYPAGSWVSYDTNVPSGLVAGTKYCVIPVTANTYNVSATLGGAAIAFATSGGTATATPDVMAFVSGYVHLNDRFNSYDNVQVVTPYQPIEPGDYPTGTPVVPGFTLASDVTSYADAALVLPYAWNEGIDGYGAVGTATVAGLVVTLGGGQTIENNLFAGSFIRVANSKARVVSNDTTTVTVAAWVPAAPPSGSQNYELHLGHHRNNPHHFTAGEGFLYPSGWMQPGGVLATSLGMTYSRPRARLVGNCVTRFLDEAACSTAINGTAVAQVKTASINQLLVSNVAGNLRVQRASTTHDPAGQLLQFEQFARVGYTVLIAGAAVSPSIDGLWRVVGMQHTTSGAGSYIDLQPLDTATLSVPASITGQVAANCLVSRVVWVPKHKFGSLIELAWRMAVGIGRRLIVTHLGVQSAGQIEAGVNNAYGFQGQIGWWDDDLELDWTPSNPNGLAARLRRLVEFIAPRAVRATFGSTRALKVLAIDGWQAETDASTVAGREMAARTVPTFVSWLRSVITNAGLSPYLAPARVPVQWAQITTVPWETAGLGGDVDGLVNAAISKLATFDGFASSVETDDAAKGVDPLHFNGVGEAQNGHRAADALMSLIDFAFQFRLGPAAVEVANEALTIIGDSPNVTSLEPPNTTTQARLCAQLMERARSAVLQSHPWSFATRRVSPAAITSSASTWAYAYVLPPDLLHPTAVLPPDALDDLQMMGTVAAQQTVAWRPAAVLRVPSSQPFKIETEQDGTRVLRTNQESAVLIYTARNVDFDLWDPLVRQACAYRLAYLLAGATVKGTTGIQVGQSLLQMSNALLVQAAAVNAEYQQDVRPEPGCPWLP